MTTALPNDNSSLTLPQVTWPTMVRLGLFNLGLGLMSVLTLAVLNRIMISELAIPATITAGVVATSQFVAPTRVLFGQLSDRRPLFGLHRTSYVYMGTIVFGLCVWFALQTVWKLGTVTRSLGQWAWTQETIILTGLLGLIFVVYGLAIGSSSTPFTALLVDISEEKNRSKIVSIVWSMLMVGIVIGGITGQIMLNKVEQSGVVLSSNVGSMLTVGTRLLETPLEVLQGPINSLFFIVPIVVLGLAIVGTWGVEKYYSRFQHRSSRSDRDDGMSLKQSLKILTASPQTGIFFSFLVLFTTSLFMQEVVLEPYGGEVFGMSIGDTTKLNAFWGMGILLGYGITGTVIVPRLGKKNTTRLGCLFVAICFLLIIVAGFTQAEMVLKLAIFVFGIAAGLGTVGGISLMLDLTAAETAGTFIGAWGLAQSFARAIAILSGGVVLDLGKILFANPVLSYGLVFFCQAIVMIFAVWALNRVNVEEFQTTTQQAIASAMEGDLD